MESRDFGTPRIIGYDDSVLFQHLTERAANNDKRPGHAWSRVVLDVTEDGKKQTGMLEYHLDLHTFTVEITESWDGVPTARKTVTLDMH